MTFNFFQYLKDYRSEDSVEAVQEILATKWKKTAAIIREAYKNNLTDKIEAERIIKDELFDSPRIDRKFLKENIEYVIEKLHTISEGDIKIIINNGEKGKGNAKNSEVEFDTESISSKRGPGRPKMLGEKKSKKEKDEEEIIVDVPSDEPIDDLTVTDEPKEVTIKVIKGETEEDKTTIEVIENENTIDTLPVDETSVDAIIDFLETFYKEHEYTVTVDKGEEKEEEESDMDEPAEISGEESTMEEPVEEDMGSLVKESASLLKWNDLFKEDNYDYDEGMIGDSDMIGKIAYLKGSSEAVTITDYNQESDEVSYISNSGVEGTCSIADISDMERADDPTEDVAEMTEEMTEETPDELEEPANESEIIDGEVLDEAQKKMAWLKKKSSGSKGKGSSGIKLLKKTPSTGSYTKSSNMKPKEQHATVKIPKVMPSKSAPSGSYTAKNMSKTMQKISDVPKKKVLPSKNAPAGKYSASPCAPKEQHAPASTPKMMPNKPAPSGTYTKNSGMKTLQKQAQGSPKKVISNVKM